MSNSFNELQAAEAFLQVAQTGSFAGAAKLRGENPSSVTRAIAQLEVRLGNRLFNRTTRSVKLTEAGELYLRYAQAMLQSQQEAREALNLLNSGSPHGLVRVSMPVVFGEQLLAFHMEQFHKDYPDIQLQFDLSNRAVNLIEEGVDLALRVGPLADSSMRALRVGNIQRKVYVSKKYAEVHGVPKTPAELAQHPTIAFAQRGIFADWSFWCKKTGRRHPELALKSWFTCSSPTMVIQMIRQGLGVGRSASWMVDQTAARDDLQEVLKDWRCEDPDTDGIPMYLLYPPGPASSTPAKVRAVAEFIRQRVPAGLDG